MAIVFTDGTRCTTIEEVINQVCNKALISESIIVIDDEFDSEKGNYFVIDAEDASMYKNVVVSKYWMDYIMGPVIQVDGVFHPFDVEDDGLI